MYLEKMKFSKEEKLSILKEANEQGEKKYVRQIWPLSVNLLQLKKEV